MRQSKNKVSSRKNPNDVICTTGVQIAANQRNLSQSKSDELMVATSRNASCRNPSPVGAPMVIKERIETTKTKERKGEKFAALVELLL